MRRNPFPGTVVRQGRWHMGEYDEELRRYTRRRERGEAGVPTSGDYDDEDTGYEQWEHAYVEGDRGEIQETYLLDPDEEFSEEDLLFAENVFEPHMMGSPVPKDGLEVPDVPGWELDSDEATTDPYEAIDGGQVYYPPEDPPILPSEQLRDAEIAGGFATSADDVPYEDEDVPERFDDSDVQIEYNVRRALRLHSSTSDLRIKVQVTDGVVTLRGRVPTLDDAERAADIALEVDGVEAVREQLTVD